MTYLNFVEWNICMTWNQAVLAYWLFQKTTETMIHPSQFTRRAGFFLRTRFLMKKCKEPEDLVWKPLLDFGLKRMNKCQRGKHGETLTDTKWLAPPDGSCLDVFCLFEDWKGSVCELRASRRSSSGREKGEPWDLMSIFSITCFLVMWEPFWMTAITSWVTEEAISAWAFFHPLFQRGGGCCGMMTRHKCQSPNNHALRPAPEPHMMDG